MRPSGNELKKEIRNEIKELEHRDLSVKYNGSYAVAVKKFMPLSKIKEIAEKYESYQRDHATGEILSGGNTFVFVEYMSWDSNKNESFTVQVPKNIIIEVEKIINQFSDPSWRNGAHTGRSYHLNNSVKELDFFKDWEAQDVSSALSLIQSQSSKVSTWINTGRV